MCVSKQANAAVTLNLPLVLSHIPKQIDAEVAGTVREPCLHALFTLPSPHFAAAAWHFEQTSVSASVSKS